jgi:hypothetical protein
MVIWLAVSSLLAHRADAATLWLHMPTAAGSCDYDSFAEALRAHLPAADIREGEPLSENSTSTAVSADADVRVEIVQGGAMWQLKVVAPKQQELERSLTPPGDSCAATAETAALMVERYLRDIHWAESQTSVLVPLPPPPPPPSLQLLLELGASGELGVVNLEPGLQLDVGLLRGPWQLEASFEAALPAQENVQGAESSTGTLQVWTGAAQVLGGRRFSTGLGWLRLEPAVGVEIYRAAVTGELLFPANRKPSWATLPFVGLRVGHEFRLWERLSITLRGELRGHLGQLDFSVDQTQAYTRLLDGDLGLVATYTFF